jgi:effector-binding domain-containing protein
MSYAVQVKHLPTQPIISIRASVPHEAVMRFYEQSQAELHAYAQQIGVAITGPKMSLWYSGPHDSPTHTDIETALPVAHLVPAQGRIQSRALPAGRVVFTIHQGAYDTLGEAFAAVWRFIEQQHAVAAGPPHDLVLVGPDDTPDPADYQTEVAWPIQ